MKQKTYIIGNQYPSLWARDIIIENNYIEPSTICLLTRDQRRIQRILSCSHHNTSVDIILAAGWHTIPGIDRILEHAQTKQFTNIFMFEYYNEFHQILHDANQHV